MKFMIYKLKVKIVCAFWIFDVITSLTNVLTNGEFHQLKQLGFRRTAEFSPLSIIQKTNSKSQL